MDKDAAFQKRLLATFKVEAEEHLQAISSRLIELEKTSMGDNRLEVIEIVFREVHSLKGAARTVNLPRIEAVCRSMENYFSILKQQSFEIPPEHFGMFYKALDTIRLLLRPVADAGQKAPGKSEINDLISRIDRAAAHPEGETPHEKNLPPAGDHRPAKPGNQVSANSHLSSAAAPETIRIEKNKLDSILLQTEGLLQAKQSLGDRVSELGPILDSTKNLLRQWDTAKGKLRSSNHAPGKDANRILLQFFESGRERIKALQGMLSSLEGRLAGDHRIVGNMVDSLVEDTKRISMTPFSTLFEILPRAVRDLLALQGKEADLRISGADVQVDRRILEELKDPLIHLIRNCADHGIDTPEERVPRGKTAAGVISVAVAYRDSAKVELTVSDDGPGINLNKVKTAAVRLGLVSAEDAEKLSEERLRAFIFRSGVSTSAMVTDISGRGLGLAIVQEKVEKLGGTISAESSADSGTVFRIILPLTLATLRGLLVRIGDRLFVIPSAHVRRAIRVSPESIKTVEGRETVCLEGLILPLVRQENLLGISLPGTTVQAPSHIHIVVVEEGAKCVAVKVDEVLFEQEFMIKDLGRQLKRVRNVSGATILGSGKVVPVLNVSDMLKSVVESSDDLAPINRPERPIEMHKSILVVEDSVTARTLLKNILETAGYEVATAVDGIDAYSVLRAEAFDLVVSDVDMPRMNGFELTAKIRSDKDLAELPVILVTALDSRQDRERGIDVGASAYIVKSNFDQSNLLGVIERFIS